MLTTVHRIAREALPSLDLVIKSAVRVAVGLTAIWVAPFAPLGYDEWAVFGGRMFIMLAAIGLFSHVEGTLCNHVASKVKHESWRLAMSTVVAIAAVTLYAREEHEDEGGMG